LFPFPLFGTCKYIVTLKITDDALPWTYCPKLSTFVSANYNVTCIHKCTCTCL